MFLVCTWFLASLFLPSLPRCLAQRQCLGGVESTCSCRAGAVCAFKRRMMRDLAGEKLNNYVICPCTCATSSKPRWSQDVAPATAAAELASCGEGLPAPTLTVANAPAAGLDQAGPRTCFFFGLLRPFAADAAPPRPVFGCLPLFRRLPCRCLLRWLPRTV